MGLIALITNSYLKGGGGADWRFCLLLSSILVDITNNSVYKGIIVSFEKRGQKWTGDVEPSAGYLVLFKWSIQHRLNIGYGSRKGKIQKIFCKSNSQCFVFSQITVEEFVNLPIMDNGCITRLSVIVWEVFQGQKVVVNRFGWNLAQKLGMMRYFNSHYGPLLWRLVLELQGRSLLIIVVVFFFDKDIAAMSLLNVKCSS